MTTQLDAIAPRVPAPAMVGQATAVEQSRAVAQVEAQVVVAKRFPRNVSLAATAMREACTQRRLAEKAFYRFPRGKDVNGKPIIISGPSIHLARELARVWGNIEYGVHEMRRDDAAGQSEMLAFAWDLETNARNTAVFINPHMRDKSTGPERLTDMRDIYESNANSGARRVREAIFAKLPVWFVEEAIDLCNKTLGDGGGKPLAQRVADAIQVFGRIGVTVGQIEAKLGRRSAEWIEQDIAQLSVIYRSLERGEISKEEEFPAERTSAADVLASAKPALAQNAADPDPPAAAVPSGEPAAFLSPETGNGGTVPEPVGASDFGKLLAGVPLGQAKDIHDFLTWKAGHKVGSLKDLSDGERAAIAAYLNAKVAGAEKDPELAATMIWDEFQAAHESGQG